MALRLKRSGSQTWNQQSNNLPDSPLQLSDHPTGMQKLQKEWEMRCHPLACNGPHVSTNWKHISAADPQLHSLSHSPYFPHFSLSRMEGKKKKARTRVRKWRGWRTEDGSSLSRTARATMDQDHGLQPSLIPWLAQELYLFTILRSIPKP